MDELERQFMALPYEEREELLERLERLLADTRGERARVLKAELKSLQGKGARVAAKYRDPVSGQTWSGRGRKPLWLQSYESQGREIEEFKV
jgi:DNA-binding protein H-NS